MTQRGQAGAEPEIGRSVRAGGVMTNYHEAGSGPPVILIHGSGPGVSAWANWRLVLPYLAERLHVFAYDQLGFGYTELPAEPRYGLERWVDHLLAFMRAVGVPRAHLVGNSMGASVALAAAVTHPAAVERLVLMGPTGVRFPITEGLDATWGYTPSVANMRRLRTSSPTTVPSSATSWPSCATRRASARACRRPSPACFPPPARAVWMRWPPTRIACTRSARGR